MRAIMLACLLLVMGAAVAQENLAPNPGFEVVGDDGQLEGWAAARRFSEGDAGPVEDVAHSGARAGRVRATKYEPPADARGNGSLGLSSDWFEAPPPNTTIQVSGWIKAQDVVSPGSYFMLRYVVYFYDEARTTKIRHRDIACTDGTFDWRRFSGHLIVPEGAAYMKLSCQLTACTGTAWFDDLSVTVLQPALTVEGVLGGIEFPAAPTVIPRPWQAEYGELVRIGYVAVISAPGDDRTRGVALAVLSGAGVGTRVERDPVGRARLILGDRSPTAPMQAALPDVDWPDLGDQGYFLQVAGEGDECIIYVGANTDQGRYYGLQTLRQLIVPSEFGSRVWQATIVDRPTVSRRGMAMGSQWFRDHAEAIGRLAALKCNFIWNQGSFMGGKFGGNLRDGARWREALTDDETQALAEYLALCRKRFIEPAVSMSPRGNPPTAYSSDADIDLVVDRLAGLYEVGFRELGLNFDDLRNIGQDRLLAPGDVESFGDDLGAAHLHFCGEVHRRLKARCPEVIFRVLPWKYAGFVNLTEDGRQYLRTLGELPAQVGMVVCANDADNLAVFTELAGRRPIVWDNWFARWERGGSPAFVPPLDRTGSMSDESTGGYIFLPMIPFYEDAAGTSWLTAADYLWSPERHDGDESFTRAVRAAMGDGDGAAAFRELGVLLDELNASPPDVAGAPVAIEALEAWRERLRLEGELPVSAFTRLDRQIDRRVKALEKLQAQ